MQMYKTPWVSWICCKLVFYVIIYNIFDIRCNQMMNISLFKTNYILCFLFYSIFIASFLVPLRDSTTLYQLRNLHLDFLSMASPLLASSRYSGVDPDPK